EKVRKSMPMKCAGKTYMGRLALRDSGWRMGRLTVLGVFCVLLAAPNLQGQRPAPSEYEVKATYLYNFARFTEWPAKDASVKGDSFGVCVLGRDPFGSILDTILAGEAIGGKQMVHRRISAAQDAGNCRIVFISSSEKSRLKETLAAMERMNVLTVSDIPDFSVRGGMIEFVVERDKIRFEVNIETAGQAGLTLSSELLKVAVSIRNSQPGE
ncbi:MAG TPA: YfiR family protein, partial [Verrucomicrobiae bacterium]|nr:YfiR family protein [Verrucomicrobiae bacterium]